MHGVPAASVVVGRPMHPGTEELEAVEESQIAEM
jgi:hypothetical protein